MNAPYFITGLPRSRTAWLANLLTWGESFCWHEASAAGGLTVEGMWEVMKGAPRGMRYVGNSDPNLGLMANELLEGFPESRFVVVLRDVDECATGMMKAMVQERLKAVDASKLRDLLNRLLWGLASFGFLPKERLLHVRYEDLDREEMVRAVWEFCVPEMAFPRERHEMLQGMRVTQRMRVVGEAAGFLKREEAA